MDDQPTAETWGDGVGAARLAITGSLALGILLDLVDLPELESGPPLARWIAAALDHPFRSAAAIGLLVLAVRPARSRDAAPPDTP